MYSLDMYKCKQRNVYASMTLSHVGLNYNNYENV